jgi:hypothetical protein
LSGKRFGSGRLRLTVQPQLKRFNAAAYLAKTLSSKVPAMRLQQHASPCNGELATML